MVPVSGNTGVTGGTHADGVIMLSTERMNRARAIRPRERIAIVEADVVLADLQEAVATHGLDFSMSVASRGSCMIGGMLFTNAGGANALRHGSARGMCLGLEAVLPTEEIMDLMSELHMNNAGYDLRHLLIGAEGTLGVIAAGEFKLVPAPAARATAFVGVSRVEDGVTLLNRLQEETRGSVDECELMSASYHDLHDAHYPDRLPPFAGQHPMTILVGIASGASRDAELGADGAKG